MAKKTPAQLVRERLALAEQEAARGNAAAAAAYAQAAANIKGSGQSKVQEVANQYAAAAAPPSSDNLRGVGRETVGQDIYGQPGGVLGPNASGGDTRGGLSAYEQEMLRRDRDARDAAARQERETAASFLRGILETYGMGSLSSQVDSLIAQWGNNTEVIAERLRQTNEYRERFKGLVALRAKGITDIADEGQYLQFESSYRRIFRDNDLQSYLGEPGSQAEIDKIARLVGDFSLSVDEVEERVIDARRVVADTAPEVRESLQRFYNIDPNLMVEFVLDPENTSEMVQRRANAAVVGGYAQRAGLEFGAGVSERIGAFLGGERDIQGTQIEPQLTEIADIQRSTQRLAEIEQGELTAETSALSALNLDREARERVRTLQSRERARFSGRSGITSSSLSMGPSV